MGNREYAVVDVNSFSAALDAGEIQIELLFDNILESNMDTLRYSLDKNFFVIKTNTEEKADYLRDKALEHGIGYVEYSYEDILALMSTKDWSNVASEII